MWKIEKVYRSIVMAVQNNDKEREREGGNITHALFLILQTTLLVIRMSAG